MDDERIIELFFSRSERAVTELAIKYEGLIRRISHNVLRSDRDTEECINDTYFAVWNSIPPQRPDSLKAYVLGVARNTALGKYHKNTARKRNSFYDTALDELAECLPDDKSVESEYDARELGREINAFLETLGREDRVMFVRRYWFSDSVADIAEMLDTRTSRVSVRLFRLREKLRRHLMEKGVAV